MYFGKKFCKNCNSELKIQNKRDVIRKNFCSRTCNGIFNGKKRLEDTDFKIRFIESSQNKESRLKKGHRLEKHPLWKERKEICCIFCGSVFKVRENVNSSVFDITKPKMTEDFVGFPCVNPTYDIVLISGVLRNVN
jgi:hypothetical protein